MTKKSKEVKFERDGNWEEASLNAILRECNMRDENKIVTSVRVIIEVEDSQTSSSASKEKLE